MAVEMSVKSSDCFMILIFFYPLLINQFMLFVLLFFPTVILEERFFLSNSVQIFIFANLILKTIFSINQFRFFIFTVIYKCSSLSLCTHRVSSKLRMPVYQRPFGRQHGFYFQKLVVSTQVPVTSLIANGERTWQSAASKKCR